MLKAYKYRIYPNQIQQEAINKHFGCCRFIYNYSLAKKIELYQKENKKISCFELIKEITKIKKQEEYKWLNEVNCQSLQIAIRNVDNAFTKFFREKKGFPKFHKKQSEQSYQCPQNVRINFDKNKISLPKIKDIKIQIDRKFNGDIKTTTISKNASNQYFVSILVDNKKELPIKKEIIEQTTIGIDVGIKDFAVCSNGIKIENPKHLKQKEKKLVKYQKRLSRKVKGSKRRDKQKLKVAKVYQQIKNAREDFLHKTSAKIVKEYDTIAIETLKVSNMVKNHNLAKAISDCSWGKFFSMLEYKCNWYGKNLLKIGQFEPSSRLCSCGILNKELTLKDREWTCKECNVIHDRDILASQNIKRFALQKQNLVVV